MSRKSVYPALAPSSEVNIEENSNGDPTPPVQEPGKEFMLFTQLIDAERDCCQSNDYMALQNDNGFALNHLWRETVTQWCYDVTDHLGEPRSVVYVAMNILDRFCAMMYGRSSSKITERTYEFASMTAIFLAMRMAGSGDLKISDLIHMSRDAVQVEDIFSMGKQMMSILSWDHRLITPQDFLRVFLGMLPSSVQDSTRLDLLDAASYLIEIAVCDVYSCRFPSSRIAYAAILNAARNEVLMTEPETELFCAKAERSSCLNRSSNEIRMLRARMDRICQRIENNHDENSPNYISDDEDEDKNMDDVGLFDTVNGRGRKSAYVLCKRTSLKVSNCNNDEL